MFPTKFYQIEVSFSFFCMHTTLDAHPLTLLCIIQCASYLNICLGKNIFWLCPWHYTSTIYITHQTYTLIEQSDTYMWLPPKLTSEFPFPIYSSRGGRKDGVGEGGRGLSPPQIDTVPSCTSSNKVEIL